MRIEAKQLYAGKRYIMQRLMVARFKDFWKENEDISIRGNFVSFSPPQEFAIEPLTNDELRNFWRTYVRPENASVTPERLLDEVGF
jgi:predicted Zn-dependent peptidase